jgi:DNA-binding NtrC family response regulator
VTDATVLLSDVAVVDTSWHAVLDLLRDHHPATPAILVADPVDRDYVAPALERGVWGILWIPVEFDVAAKLIRTAHKAAEERRLFRRDQMQTAACRGLLIGTGGIRRGPRG